MNEDDAFLEAQRKWDEDRRMEMENTPIDCPYAHMEWLLENYDDAPASELGKSLRIVRDALYSQRDNPPQP